MTVEGQLAVLCPPERLGDAVAAIRRDGPGALDGLVALNAEYPRDPRLPFLRGSILAGQGRTDEALEAMRSAVRLDPEFRIARFQLGFLELTMGRPADAQATWAPLRASLSDDPLSLFVEGLMCLIRDDFAETVRLLRRGIALNTENLPLNGDMGLIVDALIRETSVTAEDEPISRRHLLLQQYARRPDAGS
jgi:tetratricopeptide (TPR) repeat protein